MTLRIPMTLRMIAFAAVTSLALGLLGVSAATAIPANGVAISEAAAAVQPTQQVWWRRWHWRRSHWHRWRRW
jgi:hypothetical protein